MTLEKKRRKKERKKKKKKTNLWKRISEDAEM
jgi:hypothetical protein